MQLSGSSCGLCHQSIVVQGDATWCARCKTVLHRACLEDADLACPGCRQTYDAPEGYFVNSARCAECGQDSGVEVSVCPDCKRDKSFENQAAYESFRLSRQQLGQLYMVRGVIELIAAVLLALLPFLFLLGMPLVIVIALGGAFALVRDGIWRFREGKRASVFR